MADQQFLAIDLGAESGRGVLGTFDGKRVSLRELRRFPTGQGAQDINPDGVRRWDFERLWNEINATLILAIKEAPQLAGIGVDSWGVDFGLLDADGHLIEAPVQYRDASHAHAMADVLRTVSADDIWACTGIQLLPFNTLFQLKARQLRDPSLLQRARHLLLIPDLISNRLTSGASTGVELTNASTTQCLDTRTNTWNIELLEKLGLPAHFLGKLNNAGTRIGVTQDNVPVFAVGSHDTASAVAAVPAEAGSRWAYLSSGTWSLLGAEISAPQMSLAVRDIGFSNEGGVGGTTRLLKNIMGLWLVQECRRSLAQNEGQDYTYPELTEMAASVPANGPTVDATDNRFLAPADMRIEIENACRETGQKPPAGAAELIRCCLDSLALAYQQGLIDLERVLDRRFDVLHIVGGGSQNRLLNQLTANACRLPVVAGPGEATALGNILAQLVAAGAVDGWQEARHVARRSSDTETFTPSD